MLNNTNKKGTNRKLMLIGISLILLFGFIFIVSALTSNERQSLQSELDNLTSQLTNQGYSWLVNYSIDYSQISDSSKVQVFRGSGNEEIARFSPITAGENTSFERHQIFLTNLSDGESYSTFDLKSVGDVKRINRDILLKKMQVDEIRKELNREGGNLKWIKKS